MIESTPPENSAAVKFARLAAQWKRDTCFLSSTTQKVLHLAYQRIIGMGRAALPFIFCELQNDPDDWFWALSAITGEDASAGCEPGRMDQMRDRWLEWGRLHGFVG